MSDDRIHLIPDSATDTETVSMVELLMLSIETRFGKAANALERIAAGTNNLEALTAQVNRLADAFEAMAGFIGCATESIEGADGVSRCYVRTRATSNVQLAFQNDHREG